VAVRAPEALQALGSNLFRATAASGAPAAAGRATTILQGSLEGSNVNLADTMVDLTDAQRSFQMMSKAISTQDQMLEIANGVKR
jgi:flagellar basal-body rod protein FlgG